MLLAPPPAHLAHHTVPYPVVGIVRSSARLGYTLLRILNCVPSAHSLFPAKIHAYCGVCGLPQVDVRCKISPLVYYSVSYSTRPDQVLYNRLSQEAWSCVAC